MTYSPLHVRSGLTATAAVLALLSTAVSAQEAGTVPDPVAEPTGEVAAPASDPLAPEPATAEPVADEPATESTAQPEAATKAPAPTRRASAKPRAATAPARATDRSAAVPAAPPITESPVAAVPLPGPVPAPEPVASPAAEPKPLFDVPAFDLAALDRLDREAVEEALPIAGAAGLGLLALAGAGLAVRRRRRRREDQDWMARASAGEAQPAAMPNDNEPAFDRSPQPQPPRVVPIAAVRSDVPRTKLPEGFDLSRFGPHVRAAYLGPTPDNPSLSLKYRLRRASAMDQRERAAGTADRKPAAQAPRPAMPQWNAGNNGGFMLRRASPVRRPAYQK